MSLSDDKLILAIITSSSHAALATFFDYSREAWSKIINLRPMELRKYLIIMCVFKGLGVCYTQNEMLTGSPIIV